MFVLLGGLPLLSLVLPTDRKKELDPNPDYGDLMLWYTFCSGVVLLLFAVALILFELWKRVAVLQLDAGLGADAGLGHPEMEDPASQRPWYAGGGFFHSVYFQTAVLFVGFLSANYNVFVINFIKPIWEQFATLNSFVPSTVSTSLIVGIILGEVTLGHLGDQKLGLRKSFIVTMGIVIVGALATGVPHNFWAVSWFRFLVGIGVGGSYPLCATLSASTKARQTNVRHGFLQTLAVFSSQGFGLVLANAVALLSVAHVTEEPINYHSSWRICSGIGAVLALFALTLFLQVPEGPRTSAGSAHNTLQVIVDNRWKLMGTGGSWFLFDIMFYANSLFTSKVLQLVFGKGGDLVTIFKHNLLLTIVPLLGFAVAGAYLWFTNRSIKALQIFGFAGMTITYFLMALALDHIETQKWLFLVLYMLTFVFANAGPNATTFILPTFVFDESVRSTCHGFSAAAGKVGAVLGSSAMDPMLNAYGLRAVFYACGSIGVLGLLVTVFFVKTEAEGTSYRYALISPSDPEADASKETGQGTDM